MKSYRQGQQQDCGGVIRNQLYCGRAVHSLGLPEPGIFGMSWGRAQRSQSASRKAPVQPAIGFKLENNMGYKKYIRNFLSEPEFTINPSDPHFFGIAGLSAPGADARNKMPALRTTKSEPGYVPQKRYGGAESYSYAHHSAQTMETRRCYRVMTYISEGNKNVMVDITDGTRIKDFGDKLNHNIVVFDSERSAKCEKFASFKYDKTPRILVAFECWGLSTKRIGGGSTSFMYENARYAGIVKCLDVQVPFAQNHYQGRDFKAPPRMQSSNTVRVSRRI